jgi:hypothetical protein
MKKSNRLSLAALLVEAGCLDPPCPFGCGRRPTDAAGTEWIGSRSLRDMSGQIVVTFPPSDRCPQAPNAGGRVSSGSRVGRWLECATKVLVSMVGYGRMQRKMIDRRAGGTGCSTMTLRTGAASMT